MEDGQEVVGRPPSANQQMWLDLGRGLAKGSIDAIEGTARNLLTAVGVLEGLYFHAVSFEKVYERIKPMAAYLGVDTWLVAGLFGLPVVLWLASAAAAAAALTVSRHDLHLDSPGLLEREIKGIAAGKYRWVRAGLWLLLAGLLVLAINVFVYLGT